MLGTSGNREVVGPKPDWHDRLLRPCIKKWLLLCDSLIFVFYIAVFEEDDAFWCLYFNCVQFYQTGMFTRDHIGLCTFVHVVLQLYFPFILNWIEGSFFLFYFWYVYRMWYVICFLGIKSCSGKVHLMPNNQHKLFLLLVSAEWFYTHNWNQCTPYQSSHFFNLWTWDTEDVYAAAVKLIQNCSSHKWSPC